MKHSVIFFFILVSSSLFAWNDPTEGKPFFPWMWEDQFKPTLKKSVDGEGVTILATGVAASWAVRPYDHKIFDHHKVHGNSLMGKNESGTFGKLGNGLVGVGLAGFQIFFDQEKGLKTAQTIILASTSHLALTGLTHRNRPDNKTDFLPWPSSFPSGHATNAFALAGSIAYSYGAIAGVPAYLFASAVSISRVNDERHWASDIVAGATIGTFWARAAFESEKNPQTALIVPVPVDDGLFVMAVKDW